MINHFAPFFVLRSNATRASRANVRDGQSALPKAKAFGISVLVALAALSIPSLASAQQVLTLKGAPQNGDGHVTIGDVFDNAGPIAGVLLGYRNGNSAILDAATVQSIVGANGGYWANPRGQHRIVVTATGAGTAQVAPPVQRVAQPENPFASQPFPTASATVGPAPATVAMTPPSAQAQAQTLAARGPIVVHRMEIIDVTWSAAGMALTMSGVAQKDGAAGESVAVQNPTSKKMIDAVITGPGHAAAGPDADKYRSATLQLSSR